MSEPEIQTGKELDPKSLKVANEATKEKEKKAEEASKATQVQPEKVFFIPMTAEQVIQTRFFLTKGKMSQPLNENELDIISDLTREMDNQYKQIKGLTKENPE